MRRVISSIIFILLLCTTWSLNVKSDEQTINNTIIKDDGNFNLEVKIRVWSRTTLFGHKQLFHHTYSMINYMAEIYNKGPDNADNFSIDIKIYQLFKNYQWINEEHTISILEAGNGTAIVDIFNGAPPGIYFGRVNLKCTDNNPDDNSDWQIFIVTQ